MSTLNTTLPQIAMQDYKAFIRLCYSSGAAIMCKGPPGVGKARGQEQHAREMVELLADD